jgi:hypothetical protein
MIPAVEMSNPAEETPFRAGRGSHPRAELPLHEWNTADLILPLES